MNKYDVLVSFTDNEDTTAHAGANVYWAGKSTYPRAGYTPPEKRIAYLLGAENRFKRPVIQQQTQAAQAEAKDAKK